MRYIKGKIMGLALGLAVGMIIGAANSECFDDIMRKGKKEFRRMRKRYMIKYM